MVVPIVRQHIENHQPVDLTHLNLVSCQQARHLVYFLIVEARHTKVCADQVCQAVHVEPAPPLAIKPSDPEEPAFRHFKQAVIGKSDAGGLGHAGVRLLDGAGIRRIHPREKFDQPGLVSVRIRLRPGDEIVAANTGQHFGSRPAGRTAGLQQFRQHFAELARHHRLRLPRQPPQFKTFRAGVGHPRGWMKRERAQGVFAHPRQPVQFGERGWRNALLPQRTIHQ